MSDMKLKLDIIKISDVCFGSRTFIRGGVLTVNKAEIL